MHPLLDFGPLNSIPTKKLFSDRSSRNISNVIGDGVSFSDQNAVGAFEGRDFSLRELGQKFGRAVRFPELESWWDGEFLVRYCCCGDGLLLSESVGVVVGT